MENYLAHSANGQDSDAHTDSVSGTLPPSHNVIDAFHEPMGAGEPTVSHTFSTVQDSGNTSAPSRAGESNINSAEDSNPTLVHSGAAQMYIGKRIPQNTSKANKSALRAFARFIIDRPGFIDTQLADEPDIKNYHFENAA